MEPEREQVHWILPPEVFDEFYENLIVSETRPPGEKLSKLFNRPTPFTRDCE